MTVAIMKKDLIPALDNGQVRFHTDGDLTPTDVDEILRANADCLADASGNSDVDIEPLFPNEPVTKIATHNGRKSLQPKVLPAPLKRAKFVLDNPDKAFAHSDRFAKIMDEASRWAVIRNYDFER